MRLNAMDDVDYYSVPCSDEFRVVKPSSKNRNFFDVTDFKKDCSSYQHKSIQVIDFSSHEKMMPFFTIFNDCDWYSDTIGEMVLEVYGVKYFPRIFPGVHHYHPPCRIPLLYPSFLSLTTAKYEDYAWWFTVISEYTMLSIHYFYPYKNPLGKEGIVYGVSDDLGFVYKHSHTQGEDNDQLCWEILETSIKHWVLQQYYQVNPPNK
jgi:hypothetical protein